LFVCLFEVLFCVCLLCATWNNVHPSSSFYCKSHYMCRPNWPSASVLVVCLKKLLSRFPTLIAARSLDVAIVLLPCTCLVYLQYVIGYTGVLFEFRIYVYSLSAYLMLLTVLFVCSFYFGSVCSCIKRVCFCLSPWCLSVRSNCYSSVYMSCI
jgi:hypothetical protein